ncbi:MAG: hypothetical protein KBI47_10970 [Armatimonadetes bacterium]|nr:hypothetical protein [Armatimonadota bacterium]MDI9585456.1 hypothetical protein [Acidobacteriota bacterium]
MGAPDFFFAVNATFNHILETYGEEALHRYWQEMGREHYRAVTEAIRQRGLQALKEHWEGLFPEEPGSDVSTRLEGDALTLEVRTCPAILHLRTHGREILPCYCDHCAHVSRGMCEPAGVSVEVTGGMGSCVQVFKRR